MSAIHALTVTPAGSGAKRSGAPAVLKYDCAGRWALFDARAWTLVFYLVHPDPVVRKENLAQLVRPLPGPGGGKVGKLEPGWRRPRPDPTGKPLKSQDNCAQLESWSRAASRVMCVRARVCVCRRARIRRIITSTFQLSNFTGKRVRSEGDGGWSAGWKVGAASQPIKQWGEYSTAIAVLALQHLDAGEGWRKFRGSRRAAGSIEVDQAAIGADLHLVAQLGRNGRFAPFLGGPIRAVGRVALEGVGQVPVNAAQSARRHKPVRLAGRPGQADRRGTPPGPPRARSRVPCTIAGAIFWILGEPSCPDQSPHWFALPLRAKTPRTSSWKMGSGERRLRSAGRWEARNEGQGEKARRGKVRWHGERAKLGGGFAHVK